MVNGLKVNLDIKIDNALQLTSNSEHTFTNRLCQLNLSETSWAVICCNLKKQSRCRKPFLGRTQKLTFRMSTLASEDESARWQSSSTAAVSMVARLIEL